MAEYLSHTIVTTELARLVQAFPSARRDLNELAEVYKQGLTGIGPSALHAAVDLSIQEDQYFPKVSRLRALAGDYAKRHPSPFAPSFPANDPDICPTCGARALPRMIATPKTPGLDPLKADSWETVQSKSLYMDHNPDRHQVYDRP